ncbi:MAG TPA: hypothetical protein VMF33_06960 [Acidimicrobiales bacterium]|nr:hypothetical protein [Acidimicrobiales bacterium]
MGERDEPLERFLAQPSEQVMGDHEEPEAAPSHVHRTFRSWLHHFMFEKEPSDYSSIAPRRSDGSRTNLFFFNGNGRGR